jgi:hypothetical protein
MLKTISAALLAVSVLAAPALAASDAKTAPAPATKTVQAPVAKITAAPVIKAEQVKVKPAALNANAKMGRHHVRHASHHRSHKHVGAIKTHKFSKVTAKHITPATKRG